MNSGSASNLHTALNLVELSLLSISNAITDGLLVKPKQPLPSELSERLFMCLSAHSLLDRESELLSFLSPFQTSLDLSNYFPKDGTNSGRQLPSEGFIQDCIFKCINHLQNLYCRNNRISFNTLYKIATSNSHLKVIDLTGCYTPLGELTIMLIKGCSELTTLILSGTTISDRSFNFASDSATYIGGNSHYIKFDVKDDGTCRRQKRKYHPTSHERKRQKIGQEYHHYSLKQLAISGCLGITNTGVASISVLFPNLSSIDCSHIPIDDIRPLLMNCRQLRSINVSGCNLDQSKPFLPQWISNDFKLSLEEISFSGTGNLEKNFTDLLEHCSPNLKTIRLRNKTLDDIHGLSWISNGSNLQCVDLYSMPLSSSFISDLLASRESLKVLDITHCTGISETDIFKLVATELPTLQSLTLTQHSIIPAIKNYTLKNWPCFNHLCINLDRKYLLSEEDIRTLSISCGDQMEYLELWNCETLTYHTILFIVNSCQNLKKLLLSTAGDSAPSLSDNEFSNLVSSFPNIQFKIWYHTISGNRHFRYHHGLTDEAKTLTVPRKVNALAIDFKIENNIIAPVVLVDQIPIWSNETAASLGHLRKTCEKKNCGALPLISEWCCECDIDNYNGVLFYHDQDYICWETHEPGIKTSFCFSKDQYTKAINDARLRHLQLLWQKNMTKSLPNCCS